MNNIIKFNYIQYIDRNWLMDDTGKLTKQARTLGLFLQGLK